MTNKSLTNYLAETKHEYKYVLKFAIHDMTDKMITCLENCLVKYEIKSASPFRKTPIQLNPLDFPNIKNMPVFICDIVLEYPASLDFLRTYISNSLGISPSELAVYSENDPRQIETDLYLDRNSPEFKAKYKTRLGNNDYEDVNGAEEAKYGAEYNMSFLKELNAVNKEQYDKTVKTINGEKPKEDHSTLPSGYHDFNSDKNLPKNNIGFFGRVKKSNLLKTGAL